MKPMTVILVRPSVIADPSLQPDTCIAHVEAATIRGAIDLAQNAQYEMDLDPDDDLGIEPSDYAPLYVFEGHIVAIGGAR